MGRKPRSPLLFTVAGVAFLLTIFLLEEYSFTTNKENSIQRPDDHHHHRRHHNNLIISDYAAAEPKSTPQTDSILLPQWEILILLPSQIPPPNNGRNLTCLFHNNAAAPATFIGTLPSSDRAAASCSVPRSVQRLRKLYAPHLVGPDSSGPQPQPPPPSEMIRWRGRVAYESLSTPRDVVLFAKGVNRRREVNYNPDVRCAFLVGGRVFATTQVSVSAQEVFRCPHPVDLRSRNSGIVISLIVGRGNAVPIPSIATYKAAAEEDEDRGAGGKTKVCACTMVHNVAKFLREWVVYHSSIGVDRFVLYDNGSDDDLDSAVRGLEGFNITTRFWPWPKTQEAGFSHCAATEAEADSCEWMVFVDVDEFLFSPNWSNSTKPDKSMIPSILPVDPSIGQLSFGCRNFGPSGHRDHPSAGVTQGYTCRVSAEERVKSAVRLKAMVGGSLVNAVHHFGLSGNWAWRRATAKEGVVDHFKYQAWTEFRKKFRRRVSAYVTDWTESANPGSKDRAPGLGFEPVEPADWATKFCDVNDTGLRDAARRWFGAKGPAGEYKMVWEA